MVLGYLKILERKKEKTAMFKKQGTSKGSASTTSSCDIKPGFHEARPTDMGSQASACGFDMAWASEELVELSDEEELARVVGGWRPGSPQDEQESRNSRKMVEEWFWKQGKMIVWSPF